MTKVKFQNFQIFKNPNHNFTKRALSCFEKIKNQIHDFLVKKHFPEQSSLSCFGKHFTGFLFKYNRGMLRSTDPHCADRTHHPSIEFQKGCEGPPTFLLREIKRPSFAALALLNETFSICPLQSFMNLFP